jgi:hypothetical protein
MAMHPAHLAQLRRVAFGECTNGREVLARVRALDQLVKQDGRVRVEEVSAFLIWSLSNPYNSWEGSRAATMGGELLSYIKECTDGNGREFPSETPDALVTEGSYWPYRRAIDIGYADLWDFEQTDLCDSHKDRDRWRTSVEGPPGERGWRPGATPDADAESDPPDIAA